MHIFGPVSWSEIVSDFKEHPINYQPIGLVLQFSLIKFGALKFKNACEVVFVALDATMERLLVWPGSQGFDVNKRKRGQSRYISNTQ